MSSHSTNMTSTISNTFLLLIFVLSALTAPLTVAQVVNPVSQPIRNGRRQVHTRFFAQIPDFNRRPVKIVGIVNREGSLYVTTSTTSGKVYRVFPNATVTEWFDVAAAMARYGRPLNIINSKHGGVRGIAFHPGFKRNGLFYISAMEDRPSNPRNFKYFTTPPASYDIEGDSVVVEFRYSNSQQKVLASSYRTVMRIAMPVYDHPVKQIAFQGNNLLIGHGDGSVQSAIAGGGMNNDALGKVLRINPRRRGSSPYSIPSDNPFIGNPRWRNELYAVGFRNPHNLCVSARHGVFVTDAGRDNVEEINILKPGGNYGWSAREGTFVHRKRASGIVTGVGPLPADDARFNYIYPNAQVGHYGARGAGFVGQALAGACPVENSSPLRGLFLYANFPGDGALYYSWTNNLRRAKVTGPPNTLTQARTFQAKVYFDHDRNPSTPPLVLNNLRDVVRRDTNPTANRVDVRFGRGSRGEIYWSSKTNGRIYVITSTLPGATI